MFFDQFVAFDARPSFSFALLGSPNAVSTSVGLITWIDWNDAIALHIVAFFVDASTLSSDVDAQLFRRDIDE